MSARRFPWVLVLGFLLSFVACADKGAQSVGDLQPGGLADRYTYKAYNSKGVPAVSGTMMLEVIDSTDVRGTWSFVAVLPSEQVGPQVGTGTLRGTIQKSSISINLNPGWADNNVFLQGAVSSNRIAGLWIWSTFAGPTAEGTFEATRVFTTQKTND